MYFLWVGFAVLTLLALLMVLMPVISALRKPLKTPGTDAQETNLLLFRDRLAELQRDMDAGRLSADEFTGLKTELEKSLLNDLPGPATDNKATRQTSHPLRSYALIILCAVFIPVTAVGLYTALGDYNGLQQAHWSQETRQELSGLGSDMNAMLARLEQRLADNPAQIEGWIMLGQSYMGLERYAEASQAYRQLATQLQTQGEDPAPAYGLLAQALYFNTGHISEVVQQAIDQALAANPEETNTLSLLGIAAFQENRFEQAIAYWQQVLQISPNDPSAAALRNGIARAEQLIEQQAAQADAPSQTAGDGAQLQVQLTLAADLAGQANPDDEIFVLARPPGTRMPVAVTKLRVAELPLEITLTDAMSMGPMGKLSATEQVEVVARISKNGTPQPQSGDFEGIVGPITPAQQQGPVTLEINQMIP